MKSIIRSLWDNGEATEGCAQHYSVVTLSITPYGGEAQL